VFSNGFANRNGGGGGLFGGRGALTGEGLAIQGTVTAVSDTSLTLALPSGATIDVPLGPATTYHRQAAASASDLHPGVRVLVQVVPAAAGETPSPTSPSVGSGGSEGGSAGPGGASPQPVASGGPFRFGQGGVRLGPARDVTILSP
jgi:hypothetical protein